MLRELRDWVDELACRAGLDGLRSAGRRLSVVALVGVACFAAVTLLSGASTPAGGAEAPGGVGPAPSGASREASSTTSAVLATVTVHVVGEVRRPGVYELPGGARAVDAVVAAGGLLGDAEQSAVNLARVVADGEQIAVPRQGEAASGMGSAVGGVAAAGGKVDLNSASEAQLDTLPGVGPATAQKIVADRTANGPFRRVDDLMRVPGIGPAKFESLKDLVSAG